ncbi:Rnf-Nqr domain containing protein [Stutzerimonas kirkiae]|uniref:Electron transport complex subunit RsxA n=1 Tax=Stutzerimonas kirkiae TaxID=2211392 RepID=A0A4Q9R3U5_9GAMM|nr:Rnf-Nqr domain containing protein [Stutzerimonas kirkiae]TBU94600.1 electron transport complex subunit RsxA [Stutzerimonas kirkiae]TBV00715.1 electron transport complex subunit RsxA [Stutzerimonas kirkiae]TBV02690.1 electron transport complex subunit RsxA [Stutzerimonas kirkiae]TBV12801.1 electron transport complex subunit RsxA [Stutzerimonas kirkiae]
MTEPALIMVSAILVNNFVLAQFIGLSSLPAAPRQLQSALLLGLLSTAVAALSALCNHLLLQHLLLPLELVYLRNLAFILVILPLAQAAVMFSRRYLPRLALKPQALLTLLACNALLLGVALLDAQRPASGASTAMLHGLAAGLGFTLVLVLFVALRQRLAQPAIPVAFRGAAIDMISLGLMSLAFMGFNGLLKA